MAHDLASRIREAALLEGDFVLSSGERSSFYVDKYLFSTEPELLRDVAEAISEKIPYGVERLAGVERDRPQVRQGVWDLAPHRRQPRARRAGGPDRGRRNHGHTGRAGGEEPHESGGESCNDRGGTGPT